MLIFDCFKYQLIENILMSELTKIMLRIIPFLVVIIVISVKVRKGDFSKEELGIQNPESYRKAISWWVLFLLFCVITEMLLYKFNLLEVKSYTFDYKTSLLKIIGMLLLAPIAEELLYRGLFLSKLIQFKVNKHAAIFIIAVLFVLLHSFAYEQTLASKIGIVQVFIDATLFGYARLNTKSVYTSIVMHITGNLIAIAEMYLL
ncbi:MAG: CPBP family intramembrane metalloprotease [Chitinophagales bacterium]|nr:CPBP family intramembrane metalloprotease [Chitinophagales bacterium]